MRHAEEGCLGRVGGKGADCDGPCGIETVILNDYGRPRFARVLWATGDRPDLASPHRVLISETASMKRLIFLRVHACCQPQVTDDEPEL